MEEPIDILLQFWKKQNPKLSLSSIKSESPEITSGIPPDTKIAQLESNLFVQQQSISALNEKIREIKAEKERVLQQVETEKKSCTDSLVEEKHRGSECKKSLTLGEEEYKNVQKKLFEKEQENQALLDASSRSDLVSRERLEQANAKVRTLTEAEGALRKDFAAQKEIMTQQEAKNQELKIRIQRLKQEHQEEVQKLVSERETALKKVQQQHSEALALLESKLQQLTDLLVKAQNEITEREKKYILLQEKTASTIALQRQRVRE